MRCKATRRVVRVKNTPPWAGSKFFYARIIITSSQTTGCVALPAWTPLVAPLYPGSTREPELSYDFFRALAIPGFRFPKRILCERFLAIPPPLRPMFFQLRHRNPSFSRDFSSPCRLLAPYPADTVSSASSSRRIRSTVSSRRALRLARSLVRPRSPLSAAFIIFFLFPGRLPAGEPTGVVSHSPRSRRRGGFPK